eukprot:TRINITY_DN17770_c0_g2_i1.p1 TRINITY_DN17770_c0_g2~~TRINITY_DN17770_c0_g2_i1.p1  ORF type:complete len:417 (-),score=40.47 TRINITY_DN17770_c0_g2_i1:530-1711(-)
MALILSLQGSLFSESEYGSKLALSIGKDGGVLTGQYAPPNLSTQSPKRAHGAGVWTIDQGVSELHGSVEAERGTLVQVKGTWRHIEGVMSHGQFQMTIDTSTKEALGWWSEEGSDTQYPWKWTAAKISRGAKLQSGLAWFVQSIWLSRYSMFCAELFFVMTGLGWLMALFEVSGPVWIVSNIVFNAIYSTTYASFLAFYYVMSSPPTRSYVVGVAQYFLGYVTFMVLYALVYYGGFGELVAMLYITGSALFTSGSVCLVQATMPGTGSDSSLFWGSVAFLLGSVVFLADSLLPELVSVVLRPSANVQTTPLVSGLGVFTIGRIFFISGSITEDCDAFYRSNKRTAQADNSKFNRFDDEEDDCEKAKMLRATADDIELLEAPVVVGKEHSALLD